MYLLNCLCLKSASKRHYLHLQVDQLIARLKALEDQLSLDACAVNPCRNGGSCIDTFQGFACQCTDNWEGATCEQDVNECAR